MTSLPGPNLEGNSFDVECNVNKQKICHVRIAGFLSKMKIFVLQKLKSFVCGIKSLDQRQKSLSLKDENLPCTVGFIINSKPSHGIHHMHAA